MVYYHASKYPLTIGTILESRFHTNPAETRLRQAVMSALREDPLVMKGLLLADVLEYALEDKNNQMSGTLLEVVLEQVREQHFPDMPTRIGARFLFSSQQDSIRYQQRFTRCPHLLSCEVEGDVSSPLNIDLIKRANALAPITEQLEFLNETAMNYWGGQPSDDAIWEYLTHGKVTVVGKAGVQDEGIHIR